MHSKQFRSIYLPIRIQKGTCIFRMYVLPKHFWNGSTMDRERGETKKKGSCPYNQAAFETSTQKYQIAILDCRPVLALVNCADGLHKLAEQLCRLTTQLPGIILNQSNVSIKFSVLFV